MRESIRLVRAGESSRHRLRSDRLRATKDTVGSSRQRKRDARIYRLRSHPLQRTETSHHETTRVAPSGTTRRPDPLHLRIRGRYSGLPTPKRSATSQKPSRQCLRPPVGTQLCPGPRFFSSSHVVNAPTEIIIDDLTPTPSRRERGRCRAGRTRGQVSRCTTTLGAYSAGYQRFRQPGRSTFMRGGRSTRIARLWCRIGSATREESWRRL